MFWIIEFYISNYLRNARGKFIAVDNIFLNNSNNDNIIIKVQNKLKFPIQFAYFN